MSEPEVFRTCPQCGSQELPKLIVRSVRVNGYGSNWQCHACRFTWSDSGNDMRSVS